jgi:hypothetical protein
MNEYAAKFKNKEITAEVFETDVNSKMALEMRESAPCPYAQISLAMKIITMIRPTNMTIMYE